MFELSGATGEGTAKLLDAVAKVLFAKAPSKPRTTLRHDVKPKKVAPRDDVAPKKTSKRAVSRAKLKKRK